MDLNDIGSVSDTTEIELYDIRTQTVIYNDDETPMTIVLHGPYSSKQKRIRDQQQNRRIKRSQRTGGKLTLTAEELYEDQTKMIVACIESWNIQMSGEKLPCNEENIRTILEKFKWIREQIEFAMEDGAAFLTN
jgi:S-methylmethionine-dependent homocysteine/selenocysteine methylase